MFLWSDNPLTPLTVKVSSHNVDVENNNTPKIRLSVLDFRTLLRDTESTALNVVSDNYIKTYDADSTTKALLNAYEAAYDKDAHIIPNKKDLHALFEIVTHVDTKYEATDYERRILIFAGRTVVRMQKQNILNIMYGNL